MKTGKFNVSFPLQAFDDDGVVPPAPSNRDIDGDGVNDLADTSITRPRVANAATENRRGVIVTATNADDIAQFVAGAGVGGGFAVGLSIPATLLRVDANAEIGDGAQVNISNQTSAGAEQSVIVAAGTDLSSLSLSGALSLGLQARWLRPAM